MPMPRKQDVVKNCLNCGTRLKRKRWTSGTLESNYHFNKRLYCDQKCMAEHWSARPRNTEVTSWSAIHAIAREAKQAGNCEICGKENAIDVHHKDKTPANNAKSNLMRVCRSCHNTMHHPHGICRVCGAKMKGLGYCEKHYQRFKKYGNPMAKKINQHTGIILSED